MHKLRYIAQEFRELGLASTWFRMQWELKARSGYLRWQETQQNRDNDSATGTELEELPFADVSLVRSTVSQRTTKKLLEQDIWSADEACSGRIRCFGRWFADFGNPVDWTLNPRETKSWRNDIHWSQALSQPTQGDIKITWEVARFPHGYLLARMAAASPPLAARYSSALAEQIFDFRLKNPVGKGIHWNSNLETSVRSLSWLFASHVFSQMEHWQQSERKTIASAVISGTLHTARHIKFAEMAVANDHLVAEALLLMVAGLIYPDQPESQQWQCQGLSILTQQASRQFYDDGGYLMLSHNYHRAVLQLYLWAWRFHEAYIGPPPIEWKCAMERSLDFLISQQNTADGTLPNFGANDGAQFHILSSCDFTDFRPTLQAISVAVRNERVYEEGPWDEESLWLFGQRAIDAPLRQPNRTSVSFIDTGIHVLRGKDQESFATFRCGSIADRYGQMDMLHLDVWWKGQNVLVDGGSYLYNGPAEWHKHFNSTASHNTITVDDHDQMLHWRKFKNLYPTQATLLQFEQNANWSMCSGEHYGFQRHPGKCTHRRSLLFNNDCWIVVDRITGKGRHKAKLHWSTGDFPLLDADHVTVQLNTPKGKFSIVSVDSLGKHLPSNRARGQHQPPRGWQSRYYGLCAPTPSLMLEQESDLPIVFVTILCAGIPEIEVNESDWTISTEHDVVRFRLWDGLFRNISAVQLNSSKRPVAKASMLMPQRGLS